MNCVIAAFAGHELNLTQTGDGEAYLIRKNKFSNLTDALRGKNKELFVNIASGEMMPDDKLVFTTDRLLRMVTHNQLAQWLSEGVSESTEAIRDTVMADESSSIAIASLHVKIMAASSGPLPALKNSEQWERLSHTFGKWMGKAKEKIEESEWAQRIPSLGSKNILWILAASVVVLVAAVAFLMNSSRTSAIRSEYSAKLEKLNQDLQVANTKGFSSDTLTANAILEKIENEVGTIMATPYFHEESLDLLDRVKATRDDINNIKRLKEVTPFIDLTAKKSEVNAIGLNQLDDKLYAFEYNTLHEIILDQALDPKQIDEDEVMIESASLGEQNSLLFLTQSGRIIEYSGGKFSFADTDDQSWKSGVDIAAYGRFLYLLSPANNQIYKYPRLRSNFSSGSAYNNDADLSGAVSMAIDGSIYVLKSSGKS
ncbi:hypothetical protein IPJ72_06425 [Candidatus Peregrinibacteria bacterium]|nr:MAG: hypothetical protein IPJ72_06425 [Candidatus Peregrinibacteria bacterium]